MNILTSTSIVLPIDNIDTDQIIPAKFLKETSRTGFGKNLFYNWRYKEDGTPNSNFAFNQFERDSKILIAGNNFGCGSSREHAAWALADYGIKVVISSQFADIFKGNALNNGILPIEVSSDCLRVMKKYFERNTNREINVDLESQKLTVTGEDILIYIHFDIDPLKKQLLLEGKSELEYLVDMKDEIAEFEANNCI